MKYLMLVILFLFITFPDVESLFAWADEGNDIHFVVNEQGRLDFSEGYEVLVKE